MYIKYVTCMHIVHSLIGHSRPTLFHSIVDTGHDWRQGGEVDDIGGDGILEDPTGGRGVGDS